MAQQTAVEWLIRNVNENIPPMYIPKQVVEQAKARLKEQMIQFAITCHQEILKDRNAPKELICDDKHLFELFYTAIFKK